MSADFRETLYTIGKDGNRKWVYPSVTPGFFRARRTIVAYCLLLFYLGLPWLMVGGEQAVLLGVAERRFIFFGHTFYATDTIFLFFILLCGGLSLFFFSSLLGRVWCGWACPETVFLEFFFRPVERLIEGGPTGSKRLDAAPWNPAKPGGLEKILRKGLKYLIFAFFSWILASTTIAYFVGHEPLLNMMLNPPSENLSLFVVTLVIMGLLLFQFAWFREQFCTVLCPYARFQSVLLDEHSLIVGYDKNRGEPRGKIAHKKAGEDAVQEKGDCIDCGLCVRVCPTGIDIRNGTQLECIHCAACIDACHSIMEKVGRPTGLIRYDGEARLLRKEKLHMLRPRIVIYGLALCFAASFFLFLLSTRSLSDIFVQRGSRQSLYQELENHQFLNNFVVHVNNKAKEAQQYTIRILHPKKGLTLVAPINPFPIESLQSREIPFFIRFPEKSLGKSFRIEVKSKDADAVYAESFLLLGPHGETSEREEGKSHD